MTESPLGLINDLQTPGDRALFVHHIHRIGDTGDVKSLRVAECAETDVYTDDGNPTGDPIGVCYDAKLVGSLLPGQGSEGQQFKVSIKFVSLEERDGRPAELVVRSLRVALWTDGEKHGASDVSADITDYHYVAPISGGRGIPMDGFPVEWRRSLADHAMKVVLENVLAKS